jgi:hypothetical protein
VNAANAANAAMQGVRSLGAALEDRISTAPATWRAPDPRRSAP